MMTVRACFAAFLLMAFCVQDHELTQATFSRNFMEAARKCATENNVTVGINMTSMFNQPGTVERQVKCFSNCLLDSFSLIDGEGNFKSPAIQSFLNNIPKSQFRESMENNFKNCLQQGSTDTCEKSFQLMKCLFRPSSGGTSDRRQAGQKSQIGTAN